MTVEKFVRIVCTVFEKFEKKLTNGCFLADFGLILAKLLTSQPNNSQTIAHIGLIWCRMTVGSFVRIVWTVFDEIEKESKNQCFSANFGLILAKLLTSPPYNFDAIAHIGLSYGVKRL